MKYLFVANNILQLRKLTIEKWIKNFKLIHASMRILATVAYI